MGGRKKNLIIILRLFTVSLAIGVLSACSSGLVEKAEGMKPGDDKFLISLYAEYIALAKAENDESDFLDADHFASKAITIGGGRAVGSVRWRAADCSQEPRLL